MEKAAGEKSPPELQLERLANLLLLESRVREATTEVELSYSVANDTLALVSASTVLLWRAPESAEFAQGELFAVSGSPLPDRNSPFSRWANVHCKRLHAQFGLEPCIIDAAVLQPDWVQEAEEFVSANCIWLPLLYRGTCLGALAIFRDSPWTEAELRILQKWSATIAHAWHALRYARPTWIQRSGLGNRSRNLAIGAAIAALAMLLPIRLSVLAPAEIKSSDAVIVRSPIQGVIDEILVNSNQTVASGDLLMRLDDTGLQTDLEVARQEMEIARAELRQSSQAAAFSEEAQARLQVDRITLEKLVAEVNYLGELLARTEIRAPIAATVVVENEDELVGRPVQLGERLLSLVNPDALELELWLPVGDDIALSTGSEIAFFPNVAPEQVYPGEIRTFNYEAQLSPVGSFAYRLTADVNIPADARSRIGMRGTGKLYGERVTLFYYLFRRPIAFLRQSLGV